MVNILRKEGFILNPDDNKLNKILQAIELNEGFCPCPNGSDDPKCPCSWYRNKDICRCGLYIKTTKND